MKILDKLNGKVFTYRRRRNCRISSCCSVCDDVYQITYLCNPPTRGGNYIHSRWKSNEKV